MDREREISSISEEELNNILMLCNSEDYKISRLGFDLIRSLDFINIQYENEYFLPSKIVPLHNSPDFYKIILDKDKIIKDYRKYKQKYN